MIKYLKSLTLLSILTLLVVQCSTDTVYRSNQHAVQVGLYSIYSKKDSTPSNVSAFGYGMTALIYDTAKVQEIFLPLKFDADSSIFIFKISQKTDTIIFYHSKEQIYISDEDGFAFNMHLNKIAFTNNIIDSAAFSNPEIIYNETLENVQLYLY